MSPAYNPVFDKSDDSIFLELEWLHLLAAEGPLPSECADVLKCSRVWRIVHPRPRRFPTEAVAIVAATALFPHPVLAEVPTHAATRMADQQVTVRVVDAQTNKPIEGAQLVVSSTGERKGVTDSQGRAVLSLAALEGHEILVSREGYRPFPLLTSQLRPGKSVFVGLARIPGAAPPDHVATAPTAKPTPKVAAATPKPAAPAATPETKADAPTAEPATPKPQPTPKLEVWPVRPKTTPTPVVEEEPEPEPIAQEPAPPPRPAAKPAKPKAAKKPGKKRMRTMKAAVRPAPAAGQYRVLPGDSLWLIAGKKYGNGRLWPAIYDSNRRKIDRPDLIYPGQLLQIPAERIARAAVLGKRKRVAVVNPGDSLWTIADQFLGDGTQWPAIYRLNRGTVDDPSLIYPGQVLRLPTV